MTMIISALPNSIQMIARQMQAIEMKKTCEIHNYANYVEIMFQGIDLNGRHFCKFVTYPKKSDSTVETIFKNGFCMEDRKD